uniref:Fibrinogen C-terminal domain-containing protein n=1 Tax=Anopheles gambiae TaxID=7165 RepID=A0A453Z0Y6_ANOGA
MYVAKVIVLFMMTLFSIANVRGVDRNVRDTTFSGFAYEMVITKLDLLLDKWNEMEAAMKQDREKADQKLAGVTRTISQLEKTMNHSLAKQQTQLNQMLTEQTVHAKQKKMRQEIQKLVSKNDLARFRVSSGLYLQSISSRSCKEEPSKESGKYILQPTEKDEPFLGYCEQTAFGGGWLVFQYRYDGSVDFYRNWTEYRDGFGSMDGEFWLGLEQLHRLTAARKHELLVELKDFDGNYKYARYEEFKIGNEKDQYPLEKLGSYKGTAGNSLLVHKGMKFSTKDRDNDKSDSKCAVSKKGAWWYKSCYSSNLNGFYKNGMDGNRIVWATYNSSRAGLAYSRMLIREK